jgi:type VI secretion system protein ImpG
MSDQLLRDYERELAYFRQVAPEFARRHPAIAGRLRMSEGEIDDPHVERLIQAVAFLNARTRRKIDDDFSEISQALLQVLYPHYLAPFPSATIVQFALPPDQAELVQGFSIARESSLETEPIDGEPYRFRTCYPVTVWPIEITNAGVHRSAVPMPATRWKDAVRARIRLELAPYASKVPIGALAFDQLRFFLNAPPQLAYQLYEAIFNNCLGVVVSGDSGERAPVMLDRSGIRPVGFERDEALVQSPPRSFPGYELLNEFFVFPQKFLFFDIVGMAAALRHFDNCRAISIDICLDRPVESLERYVTPKTFQLGCCPIVNLFRQRAESNRLTQHQTEYRIVPDARRPRAYEVHSVDEVVAVSPANERVQFFPFYSLTHHRGGDGHGARFWHASRRPEGAGAADRSEVLVSLVDSHFSPSVPSDWTMDVMTTCLNPRQLPFGGGQPKFTLESGGPLQPTACLTPPTKTTRPSSDSAVLWRLISHLTLNHLSLVSPDASAEPLREILKLYDMTDSKETQNVIAGLLSVRARRTAGRPGGSVSAGVCRGLEVTLHFDEDRFTGSGVYLFGAILERFLGMYSSINSFTRTVITTNRRDGKLCEWPARAGEVVFL